MTIGQRTPGPAQPVTAFVIGKSIAPRRGHRMETGSAGAAGIAVPGVGVNPGKKSGDSHPLLYSPSSCIVSEGLVPVVLKNSYQL